MRTLSQILPGKFVKPDQLPLTLTIRSAEIEAVGMTKERKLVLRFREIDQGLIMNKTRCNDAEELFGKDLDTWVGQKVRLVKGETEFGGNPVETINVRSD
jgi:hypothetical protein